MTNERWDGQQTKNINLMRSGFALLSMVAMLAVAAVIRFMPHIPNFTPVEGITIFGAAYLGRKHYAFLLPVITLYISDLVINNTTARPFFEDQTGFVWYSDYMVFNALALIVVAVISTQTLKKINFITVPAAAVASSVVFYVVTNFGVWLTSQVAYTKDMAGLMACFAAGLPFFKTSLLSTVAFTAVIFTVFEYFKKQSAVGQTTVAP